MTAKVLTGFTVLTDGDLDVDAAKAVTGLTGNANFKLGDALTQLTDAAAAYHDSLGKLGTGDKKATVAKDEARKTLEEAFTAAAIMVNQQAKGNLTLLLSSGIKLAAAREHHYQPLPVDFKVANGNNGAMIASVQHSPVGDHGTVFAYTPATSTSTDPNTWTQKTVNGHKTTILGLAPGTAYLFTAAYKGTDDDALVWGPPITKYVGN